MRYLNKLVLLSLLTLFLQNSYAVSYNSKILSLHSKVFPKIILTDKNIENKLVDKKLKITILYNEIDLNIANSLKNAMNEKYKTIKNIPIEINIQQYSEFNKNQLSSAYYLLGGDKKIINSICTNLQNNSRFTFSYDSNYLDDGVLMSLNISKKVSPIINLNVLKRSRIKLQDSIFKIAKIK